MKYPLSSILQEERKDMTIRECYEKTGSDYESILKRFGSEAMIQRFALKFLMPWKQKMEKELSVQLTR